jgi:hypothetical protein
MATLERVEQALTDRHFNIGGVRVVVIDASLGVDSDGEDAIIVRVVLAPPEGDTWPVEDVWELRRMIRDVIASVDPELEIPWVISIESEDESEDAQDAINV